MFNTPKFGKFIYIPFQNSSNKKLLNPLYHNHLHPGIITPFYYTTFERSFRAPSTHNPLSKDPLDSYFTSEKEVTASAREASTTEPHLDAGGCQLGEVSPHLGDAVSQQPGLLPGAALGALPPHPPGCEPHVKQSSRNSRDSQQHTFFKFFFTFFWLYFFRGLVTNDVTLSLGM